MSVLSSIMFFSSLISSSPVTTAPQTTPVWQTLPEVGYAASGRGEGVPEFWVRPGYKVSIVAENFGEARFLQFVGNDTIYVSQPGRGTIQTLKRQGNRYIPKATFVEGYKSVHGLDYKDGWLWFTTSGSVFMARDKDGDGKADEVVTVLKDLPSGGHWWRSILVTNDGFFTSIGDSGNANDETATDRQKIWKYSLDGSTRELFVSGIRNTEKLRFKPGTTELYGCDHGSDNFGKSLKEREGSNQPVTDENPPCEFNKYIKGNFYGHPFVVGNKIPRYEYMNRPDILDLVNKTTPPVWSFGPHWAPNGWTFLSHTSLGGDFKGDVLTAQHGSWNRVKKAGYRIERIMFDTVVGEPYGSQPIVSTLSKNGDVLGRPVDVEEAPDGTVVFSDDGTNRIYKIEKIGARK